MPLLFYQIAPTAPPENIRIDGKKTHDTLTIHWEPPVNTKIHGDLIKYSVSYQMVSISGSQLSSSVQLQNVTVHGTLKSVMLSELKPYTMYEIKVSAVNQYGIGVYSSVITGGMDKISILF